MLAAADAVAHTKAAEHHRGSPGMRGSDKEWSEMDYLFVKLFWYLVPAFVGGLVVGWIACRPSED